MVRKDTFLEDKNVFFAVTRHFGCFSAFKLLLFITLTRWRQAVTIKWWQMNLSFYHHRIFLYKSR